MRNHYYCTLFDSNYLSRGLALHESLVARNPHLRLIILCLDQRTHAILSRLILPQVDLVSLGQLHLYDPELAQAEQNRTRVEYYFTSKSVLMNYVLDHFEKPERVTYLDSDLFYFNDPALLENEVEGSSIALTPHAFPGRLAERERYGKFNAGWVSAGADPEGRAFLQWWRRQCIDWCMVKVEPHRFADQKYLDQVPGVFPNCRVVNFGGANVAPWNLAGRRIDLTAEALCIDAAPLIFYHFHGVRRVAWRFYDSGLLAYGVALTPAIRRYLYRPYLDALARQESKANQIAAETGAQRREGEIRGGASGKARVFWGLLRSGTGLFRV